MKIVPVLILLSVPFGACDSPQQCPGPAGRRIPFADNSAPDHRVRLTAQADRNGRLRWNGRAVTPSELQLYLRRSRILDPLPYLVLDYEEGLDCATLTELRRAFDEEGGCAEDTFCSERQLPNLSH